MFSFAELYQAYQDCRRNKRKAVSTLQFDMVAESRLFALQEALNQRRYRPSPCACFVVRDPKLREIFAASFQDRIVHHVLLNRLEPYWERRFMYDAWAGRRGRGLHGAVNRLQCFSRQVSGNGRHCAWYLQLDVRSLFVSLDRRILYQRLCRAGMEAEVDWLVRTLLADHPTHQVVLRSPRWLLAQVPRHKSLFYAPSGKGLPIGHLTSQFFANVSLDALDQFSKHFLHIRHYVRYMDDMVLLHSNRTQLEKWHGEIESFLSDHLGLALNPKQTRLRPVSNGIDFLGYIVRPRYRLVRRRVVRHLYQRLGQAERGLTQSIAKGRLFSYKAGYLRHLQASLNSYMGHLRHANSQRLLAGISYRFEFLARYFKWSDTHFQLRWQNKAEINLRSQWLFFRRHFPGVLVLMQIGRFVECFDTDADCVCKTLGLASIPARCHFKLRCGWPWFQCDVLLFRLQQAGLPWVLIEQSAQQAGAVRARRPALLFLPHSLSFPPCMTNI